MTRVYGGNGPRGSKTGEGGDRAQDALTGLGGGLEVSSSLHPHVDGTVLDELSDEHFPCVTAELDQMQASRKAVGGNEDTNHQGDRAVEISDREEESRISLEQHHCGKITVRYSSPSKVFHRRKPPRTRLLPWWMIVEMGARHQVKDIVMPLILRGRRGKALKTALVPGEMGRTTTKPEAAEDDDQTAGGGVITRRPSSSLTLQPEAY